MELAANCLKHLPVCVCRGLNALWKGYEAKCSHSVSVGDPKGLDKNVQSSNSTKLK